VRQFRLPSFFGGDGRSPPLGRFSLPARQQTWQPNILQGRAVDDQLGKILLCAPSMIVRVRRVEAYNRDRDFVFFHGPFPRSGPLGHIPESVEAGPIGLTGSPNRHTPGPRHGVRLPPRSPPGIGLWGPASGGPVMSPSGEDMRRFEVPQILIDLHEPHGDTVSTHPP